MIRKTNLALEDHHSDDDDVGSYHGGKKVFPS
jgi:hypothetical protein